MKVVSIETVRGNLERFLKQAQGEDIVVTRNGKATAMIRGIDEEDLKDMQLESDPRFARLIEDRRNQYAREGGIRLETLARDLKISLPGRHGKARATRRKTTRAGK
jgi:hypothetical protein